MTRYDAAPGSPWHVHSCSLLLARRLQACVASAILVLAGSGCSATAQREARAAGAAPLPPASAAPRPEPCRGAPAIDLLHSWHDSVAAGDMRCVTIAAHAGERVQVVVDLGARAPLTGAIVELLPPNDTASMLRLTLGNHNRQRLSWTARASGPHHIVLRDIWTVDRTVGRIPVRLWVSSVTDAATVQQQSVSLARSDRTGWLAANAHPIRTIDPADTDFADLDFLRTLLADSRLVLLGEVDHGSASDFLAKARLVKFLHREMGFDVIAFEAPMFDMEVGWRRLVAGASPQQAFALGALGQWAHSAQMQPLIRYFGEHANSERPLRWVGFDNQPQMGSVQYFAPHVSELLQRHHAASPLADTASQEFAILRALAEVRYRRGVESIPDSSARSRFLAALDQSVQVLSEHPDDEAARWTQKLGGMARHARRVFSAAEGVSLWEASRWRNEQMAENLEWLADVRFPGRRIIVWAGNPHVMRLDDLPAAAGAGPSMGRLLSDRYGDEAFVIVTTSYEHAGGRFASDQDPLPGFEQKMQAAGFEYALVNLRDAARTGSWLGGSFPARPLANVTADEIWSVTADALLFIRTQEAWQRLSGP